MRAPTVPCHSWKPYKKLGTVPKTLLKYEFNLSSNIHFVYARSPEGDVANLGETAFPSSLFATLKMAPLDGKFT